MFFRTPSVPVAVLFAVLFLAGCGSRDTSEKDASEQGRASTGSGNGSSNENNSPRYGPPSIEPGFIALTDRYDLSGWHEVNKSDLKGKASTPDRRFSVDQGVLIVADKDRDNKRGQKDLWTIREFNRDFVLKFEFRAAKEAIGYIIVRNSAIPVGDYIRRGQETYLKSFRNDDWNEMEITVKLVTRVNGNPLTTKDTLEATFANGKPVVTLNGKQFDSATVLVRVEVMPKVNGQPLRRYYPTTTTSKGSIAIRAISGKIEYRNLRFREL
ncbi:MAG: hypothetical protein KatS3mg105_2250 [Gemmatales bacterium]|nr:MAG: hypothetical protein KatS3mg105_2250 [Gemmatales bacterium]